MQKYKSIHKIIPGRFSFAQFLFYFLIVVISFELSAEDVHMKDGKVISGRVTGQNASHIELRTKTETMWLAKAKIKKIVYRPTSEQEKIAKREAERKRLAAIRAARQKIEKENQEKAEKERLLAELKEKERQEALEIAQEKARRAEALRELVENETMEKPTDEPISYWDFAWRSMVAPGWGHFYLERPTMGYIYSGSAAALLLNVYRTRQDAILAKEKNKEEVRNNYLFTAVPGIAPQVVRAAYSLESNRKAFTDYQKKVDIYNYSAYLLVAFYGAQIIHIVYNGLAWQKGLPIVDNSNDTKSIKFSAIVLPEYGTEGDKKGASGITGYASLTFQY